MFCFLNIILEEFVNNHILIEVILNMREYKNPPPPSPRPKNSFWGSTK